MAIRKDKETHSKQKQNKNRIIRGAELKVAEQNKKTTVIMRPLQKLFSLDMKENEIRLSTNPKMKEMDEKNDDLSKQIQEDEKKENNGINNDELLPRSPENLKQSDTEPINQGDGNENVNNGSKFNRRLSKYSAAINTDWRRRALNRCYDGDIYNNLCLLYQGLYWMIR